MSDITLRSQDYGRQSRMHYEQQGQQAQQQALQMVQQQVVSIQEQHRADVGMQLTIDQAEQQRSMNKLAMAHALDQADLSREQVKGAQLQNRAMENQLKEQERLQNPESRAKADFARLVHDYGGASALANGGLFIDPNGMGFVSDKEEIARLTEAHRHRPASISEDTQAQRDINGYLNAAKKARGLMTDEGDAQAAWLESKAASYGGGGAPAAAPEAPKQPTAKPLTGIDKSTADSWAGWIGDSPAAKQIATAVYQNKDELAEFIKSQPAIGRRVSQDPDDIAREMMQHLSRLTQTQEKWATLHWLVSKEAISPQQALFMWNQSK